MNDDELPMSAGMASAYLDGELDAAERATAAADPETMALVDSFARVRAALGEVGPVVGSTRTAATAAALAEFDAIHAAAVTPAVAPAPANVTSLQSPRVRAYRLLTGVAAAVVIGVVGITALNSSGNDKSSSSATEAPAAAELPASKSADTAAASAGRAAPVAGAVSADSSIAELPVIDSAEALAQYASGVKDANSALPPSTSSTAAPQAPSPELATAATAYALPDCLTSNDLVIGTIFFQGTAAFAVRDAIDGTLRAIDAFNCRVLVSVAP